MRSRFDVYNFFFTDIINIYKRQDKTDNNKYSINLILLIIALLSVFNLEDKIRYVHYLHNLTKVFSISHHHQILLSHLKSDENFF